MKKKYLRYGVLCMYCIVMSWLLFGRAGYDPDISYAEQLRWNLIPFKTIRLYCRAFCFGGVAMRTVSMINLGGNVMMFVPLGWLLPLCIPKLRSLIRLMLTVTVLIICVELIQLLTLVGSCDIDDLILNVLGAAIGFWLYRIWKKSAA